MRVLIGIGSGSAYNVQKAETIIAEISDVIVRHEKEYYKEKKLFKTQYRSVETDNYVVSFFYDNVSKQIRRQISITVSEDDKDYILDKLCKDGYVDLRNFKAYTEGFGV